MNVGILGGFGSSLQSVKGEAALSGARLLKEEETFSSLVEKMKGKASSFSSDSNPKSVSRQTSEFEGGNIKSTLSSSQVLADGRFTGDVKKGFSGTFTSMADKNALPKGAASNQANSHVKTKTIDKTSKLYEKSMELESFFVKQMLSEMRKTVSKSSLGGQGFAGEMYQDMLYEEYA
ncbi:MAG: rod-binding protein, partial [Treponema sp.]|nr:rod-binding protein [Treponema sp.]